MCVRGNEYFVTFVWKDRCWRTAHEFCPSLCEFSFFSIITFMRCLRYTTTFGYINSYRSALADTHTNLIKTWGVAYYVGVKSGQKHFHWPARPRSGTGRPSSAGNRQDGKRVAGTYIG